MHKGKAELSRLKRIQNVRWKAKLCPSTEIVHSNERMFKLQRAKTQGQYVFVLECKESTQAILCKIVKFPTMEGLLKARGLNNVFPMVLNFHQKYDFTSGS